MSGFHLAAPGANISLAASVTQIDLRGALFTPAWTIQLTQRPISDAAAVTQSFPFCRDGKTLSLAPTPAWFP